MRWQRVLLAASALAIALIAAGCEEPPPPRKKNFLEDNPWVVKKPWEKGTGAGTAANPATGQIGPAPAKPLVFKADTEIVSPILNATGKWTIRLAFYHPEPDKQLSALFFANQHARELRKKGYDAYVTDLIGLAIVSVGSFDDERDPKLVELWRECYEDWTKIFGGRKSAFRESMEQFYGDKTVFGDQPWPVSIIEMQVKMKAAYKIDLTEDDKRRYKEFVNRNRAKTGENP